MSIPLIKVFQKIDTKREFSKFFYSEEEFEKWSHDEMKGDLSKWIIKYYMGLGAPDRKETMELFDNYKNKKLHFVWDEATSSTKT